MDAEPNLVEPNARPECQLAPDMVCYAAQVHQVQVAWRLANTRAVVIGPEPRLVLACRARRDVEALLFRVDFPELLTAPGECESLLAQTPHVAGLRRLKPEGEPWVWGQEDVDAAPMMPGGKPEDALRAPSQARWHGGTVEMLEHNVCCHSWDYWCWRGRITVPKWNSLGIIASSPKPTICRVTFAGV